MHSLIVFGIILIDFTEDGKMKKERNLANLLVTGWALAAVILMSNKVITDKEMEVKEIEYSRSIETPFQTAFKEPMIIEKEVVVEKIVEVEVPVEVVEEVVEETPAANPEPYLQPINGDYDVLTPTNLTADDLVIALGPSKSGFAEIAGAVADAERIHGVNSIYLLATLGLESGWGKYRSAENNIAGWKRGDGSGFRDFDSLYDCVMTVASGLSTSFRETHGSKLSGVTSRYCPEPDYMSKVMTIMNELQNNVL